MIFLKVIFNNRKWIDSYTLGNVIDSHEHTARHEKKKENRNVTILKVTEFKSINYSHLNSERILYLLCIEQNVV